MKSNRRYALRLMALITLMVTLAALSARLRADTETTGTCGGSSITIPFTDVPSSNIFFCAIASAYFTGLTNGTTATTYTPSAAVPREQMAAFITRTLDQSLRRGSRRAALGQWWTSRTPAAHRMIAVGDAPQFLASDGEHVYVSNTLSTNVTKVQASTGDVLTTINPSSPTTGPSGASFFVQGNLVAAGYLWGVGNDITTSDPSLYQVALDTIVSSSFLLVGASNPLSLTFDGANIWTTNNGTGPNTGSITRFNISTLARTTFNMGFNRPFGILFDGQWLWVTDQGDHTLKRVNPATSAVVQTIAVGNTPGIPTFDGTNLWVPSSVDENVKVVRAVGQLQGTVLATLTAETGAFQAAFDGERVLVTNQSGSVVLWKAADLTPLGAFLMPAGSGPTGVCSDGVKFWVTLQSIDRIVSF